MRSGLSRVLRCQGAIALRNFRRTAGRTARRSRREGALARLARGGTGVPSAGPGGRNRRQQPDARARRRRSSHSATEGYQDLATKRPVDADTIFHWASITKTFTGIAIMQLRDRGLLSLDDPVVKYVPELRRVHNPFGDISQVTIRHLMTHSAGLPRGDVAVGRRPAVASVRADASGRRSSR